MVIYCCVPLCRNNAKVPGETFHCFPKCEEIRNRWLSRIGRDESKGFKVSASLRVCSRHFLDSDYKPEVNSCVLYRRRLVPHAVPSVFPIAASSSVQSPQRKLLPSNHSTADTNSQQAEAKEDISEIVPKMEIKIEPIDDYFDGEDTPADAFAFPGMAPMESYYVKIEQEDPTALAIKIEANPTPSSSFVCTLCSCEFDSENSLRKHFVSSGEFYTCRKILEMNQPIVSLVRVDTQYKTERADDDFEIKLEEQDLDNGNLSEPWEQNQEKGLKSVGRRKQTPLKDNKPALKSHFQHRRKLGNQPSRTAKATATKSNGALKIIDNQHKINTKVCHICLGEFPHIVALRAHLTKQHQESVQFQCNFCRAPFLKSSAWQAHFSRCRLASQQNTCTVCGYQCVRFSQLRKHFSLEHPGLLRLKCRDCAYECKDVLALGKHTLSCHSKKPGVQIPEKICPVCLSGHSRNADRYSHFLRLHLPPTCLQCCICSREFVDRSAVTSHLWRCLIASDKSGFAQDFNKESASTVKSVQSAGKKLEFHTTRSETPDFLLDMKYRCDVCLQSFMSKIRLLRHIKRAHLRKRSVKDTSRCFVCSNVPNHGETVRSRRVFTCRIVAKKRDPSQLQESTNDSGGFGCQACSKTHTTEQELTLHKRKCHRPGLFCTSCRKKLTIVDATKRDIMQSHPEFLRACEKCLNLVTASVGLVDHLSKVHSIDSGYFCFDCVTIFNSEKDLLEHMNIHVTKKQQRGNLVTNCFPMLEK